MNDNSSDHSSDRSTVYGEEAIGVEGGSLDKSYHPHLPAAIAPSSSSSEESVIDITEDDHPRRLTQKRSKRRKKGRLPDYHAIYNIT